jgi:hypothetical protein
MSTAKERDEAKRNEKKELMRQQIEEGTLEVRQMTDAEKKKYAPSEKAKEAQASGKGRRRRSS